MIPKIALTLGTGHLHHVIKKHIEVLEHLFKVSVTGNSNRGSQHKYKLFDGSNARRRWSVKYHFTTRVKLNRGEL